MPDSTIKHSLTRFEHLRNRIHMFRNWYKTVFPINRFYNRPTLLVLRNGSRVWVSSVFSADLTVVEGILYKNEYHLETMGLPKDAVIYDLGANIGTFCVEAKRVCPAASMVAYEPAEENIATLKKNAPFAEVYQKAITGQTGTAHLVLTGHPHAHYVTKNEGIEVPAVSLEDAVGERKIDLLKLDIEGAEYDAIEKANPKIFSHIDRIVMETHALGDWGERKLRELGYNTEWFWQQEGENANAIIYGEKPGVRTN